MPTETELKLRLPADCVARLQRNPLLKSSSISRPVTQKLYSVYYDTPDFDLKRHGIALRLRRSGRNWVQTIKGGGSVAAGLHQRDEWEAPVLKAQPDFTKITDPALIKLFAATGLRERLQPVFTTEFTRSIRMVRLAGGGEAEFCLDRGQVIAGDASAPLCEIELELKSGNPGQLFQFALELLHSVPLRLENASKAERGYLLYADGKSPPLKAAPVELDAEMSVSAAFKAITWNCLNHLHSNETGMLAGYDIEYLHQMRVALRRQRSALSIFSRIFSKAAFVPLAQELKWLTSQFGPARDWDVFVTETLTPVCASFPDHPGVMALQDKCKQLRHQHNEAARHAVESAHYAESMLHLGAWVSTEAWLSEPDPAASVKLTGAGAPVKKFATALLTHRHRQLKKYGKELMNSSVAELHALRIVVKKQRYIADFFAGFYSGRETRRYLRVLSVLQDILGAINDTANAKRLLNEVAIAGDEGSQQEAVGIVLGWSASLAALKNMELEQAWTRFNKTKPFW
ncbi:MAG: CHAD domain-containing protein [Nitrosomonadales bacterium]|nr:MAG: CHAD domain-containing protein [Nitrosomonadales bacterium]